MALRHGYGEAPVPHRARTSRFGDSAVQRFKSRFAGERWVLEGKGIGPHRRH